MINDSYAFTNRKHYLQKLIVREFLLFQELTFKKLKGVSPVNYCRPVCS